MDGATCHTAETTLDVLRPVFEDRITSCRDDVVWPPRSCDLTPLGYYLWGAVKDKCYTDKPEIIDALKDNIREAISEIQLHTIDNVLKNWTDCMTSRGSHLNGIIFHYSPEGLHFQIKKRNLRKYSAVFLKHFPKKKVFGGPYILLPHSNTYIHNWPLHSFSQDY